MAVFITCEVDHNVFSARTPAIMIIQYSPSQRSAFRTALSTETTGVPATTGGLPASCVCKSLRTKRGQKVSSKLLVERRVSPLFFGRSYLSACLLGSWDLSLRGRSVYLDGVCAFS